MKTIKKTFEPDDENPLEVQDSPLAGVIACIAIAFLAVAVIICLAAFSVYLAETIVKMF